MKLGVYYNSWDDWSMLQHSLKNIRPLVDVVFVVISYKSNYGENRSGPDGSVNNLEPGTPLFFRNLEPNLNLPPSANETAKRNYGLQLCRSWGCTHALCMDSDEFYEPKQFKEVKSLFDHVDMLGTVVDSEVFFAKPSLTIGKDITRVPFIHKITPNLMHTFNKAYPYAWEGRQIRIDPTRSYNIRSGVFYMPEVSMYHMSWVRNDYAKKIRNSTARYNLERSTIMQDLLQAKEGAMCHFYNKRLARATVDFDIPEIP